MIIERIITAFFSLYIVHFEDQLMCKKMEIVFALLYFMLSSITTSNRWSFVISSWSSATLCIDIFIGVSFPICVLIKHFENPPRKIALQALWILFQHKLQVVSSLGFLIATTQRSVLLNFRNLKSIQLKIMKIHFSASRLVILNQKLVIVIFFSKCRKKHWSINWRILTCKELIRSATCMSR